MKEISDYESRRLRVRIGNLEFTPHFENNCIRLKTTTSGEDKVTAIIEQLKKQGINATIWTERIENRQFM